MTFLDEILGELLGTLEREGVLEDTVDFERAARDREAAAEEAAEYELAADVSLAFEDWPGGE